MPTSVVAQNMIATALDPDNRLPRQAITGQG